MVKDVDIAIHTTDTSIVRTVKLHEDSAAQFVAELDKLVDRYADLANLERNWDTEYEISRLRRRTYVWED